MAIGTFVSIEEQELQGHSVPASCCVLHLFDTRQGSIREGEGLLCDDVIFLKPPPQGSLLGSIHCKHLEAGAPEGAP